MKQLSELFGINERDIVILLGTAFGGGFMLGAIIAVKLMEILTSQA